MDAGTGTNRRSLPTPRWVRLFAIFAAFFFAVFVVLHLVGGGLGHHGLSGVGSNRASPAAKMHAVDGARRP
jgi:hypothetical protein